MRLLVPATRMELLRLKKRLKIAERGHEMLKDKLEELIVKIYNFIWKIQELRKEVEKGLKEALGRFNFAKAQKEDAFTALAISVPAKTISIEMETERILNVRVPKFRKKIEGKMRSYGTLQTSAELDLALIKLEKILDKMLELAEKEKALELLANEIEKTRRRVNALEYVLIPEIKKAISTINFKLTEMERSSQVQLMRIKEKIGK